MAPAWVSTLLISTPGHKNLLSLGWAWVLRVINTPEYKMELINRCCYYLQRAAQESNEASLCVSVWGLMLMWGILLSLTNVVLRTVCK